VLAGYYAIDSLRMEKGYRAWGRELTPDTTPVEAGLTFTCKLGSGMPFRGRGAVLALRSDGVTRRLASFVLTDESANAWGNELLLRNGESVGFVSSAAFGHTLGSAVLLGYVERRDGGKADRQWLAAGQTATMAVPYRSSVHSRSASRTVTGPGQR
jgi:glycine cleavage system aminomethyltransferase T